MCVLLISCAIEVTKNIQKLVKHTIVQGWKKFWVEAASFIGAVTVVIFLFWTDDIMYFNKKLEKEDLDNLEALGFWLMHKVDDEKDFCKQSHFWPGYIQ